MGLATNVARRAPRARGCSGKGHQDDGQGDGCEDAARGDDAVMLVHAVVNARSSHLSSSVL